MSAAIENLLLQIVDFEKKINEAHSRGEDASYLEETLSSLKSQFVTLNEALNKPQGVLKG